MRQTMGNSTSHTSERGRGRKRPVPILSDEDLAALREAHRHLEHPSLAVRLTSVVGTPIEQGLKLLPGTWYGRVHSAAEGAIRKILQRSLAAIDRGPTQRAHEDFHKVLSMGSGAIGGFFGLPALLLELPISTAIMLRSIADIAQSEGEDLSSPEAQLACMEVFAFGARSHDDDAAETGYYGVRFALALHFSVALTNIATHGASAATLPATVTFARAVASRFGVAVSDKAAFQMVPFVGAAAGALINLVFMQHFQDMARGHFTVRRLEREYGQSLVAAAYADL